MLIKTLLANATASLNTDEAAFEAQLLLQHTLNVNRAWVLAHADDVLNGFEMANLNALLERRLNGEPIAYILGYREFYGLMLKVTPATLIPRADTETLVDAALTKIPQNDNISSLSFPRKRGSLLNLNQRLNLNQKMDSRFRGNDGKSEIADSNKQPSILDLGTGTGAIALAIAKHRPHTLVTAVDFSAAALKIAQQNAQDLTVLNCQFLLSDWFSALNDQTFDVIVSNPPYIEADDTHLSLGDLRFEPISALASGADGLDAIRIIVENSKNHLKTNGWLLLEHGYNQVENVASLLTQAGFSGIETYQDLGGNNRVTLGTLC